MFNTSQGHDSTIIQYRRMKIAFENRLLALGWMFFLGYIVVMLAYAHYGWMLGAVTA